MTSLKEHYVNWTTL